MSGEEATSAPTPAPPPAQAQATVPELDPPPQQGSHPPQQSVHNADVVKPNHPPPNPIYHQQPAVRAGEAAAAVLKKELETTEVPEREHADTPVDNTYHPNTPAAHSAKATASSSSGVKTSPAAPPTSTHTGHETVAPSVGFVTPSSYLRPLGSAAARRRSASRSRSGGPPAGSGMHVESDLASRAGSGAAGGMKAMSPVDKEQMEALVSGPSRNRVCGDSKLTYDTQRAIRAFLNVRTSYDVLPLSYRLIVFDTALLVKKSLNILIQCGK